MRSGPSIRSLPSGSGNPMGAVFLAAMFFSVSFPQDTHAVTNGNFEKIPNRSWFTDGPNAPRLAQGDRPAIVAAVNGNRYGHIGDGNGIGANGENPSRFFQWFSCGDSLSFGQDCIVSFRFRSLLLPGEMAWVRIRSPTRQRAKVIPNSNNQWAAGRMSIRLPGGCEEGPLFIDFGTIKQAGGQIGGRLNIDDVEHRCDIPGDPPPPQGDEWDFLPPVPDEEDVEPVPMDELSMIAPSWEGSIALSLLILLSVLLLVIKLRR